MIELNEKGIFITWKFWQDKDTTLSEKALLLEIQNLTMLEHGCIAQNNHFATLMGVKRECISRLISSLEKKGYITSEIKRGSRNFSRTITINKMLFNYEQNVIQPLTKCYESKGNKSINNIAKQVFPNNLNSNKFKSIWNDRVKQYNEKPKSKRSSTALEYQLNKLSKLDLDSACELLTRVIEGNWQGIPEEVFKEYKKGRSNNTIRTQPAGVQII